MNSHSGCGGLNRYDPHRLMYLNALPIKSVNIRRHDLVGEGMPLLKEVYNFGVGL